MTVEPEKRKDKVVLYRRADRKWAWHRINAYSGDVVSTDGGQGYENFEDAETAVHSQFGSSVEYVIGGEVSDG